MAIWSVAVCDYRATGALAPVPCFMRHPEERFEEFVPLTGSVMAQTLGPGRQLLACGRVVMLHAWAVGVSCTRGGGTGDGWVEQSRRRRRRHRPAQLATLAAL